MKIFIFIYKFNIPTAFNCNFSKSFKINKQKIFIDFKSIPQRLEGNKLYEVIQIADSKINIIYDKNHELGEVLAKAVKNANKNDYAILILSLIHI